METFNFEKRISTLKNYSCPEIYIWNYCSDVKNKIDFNFEQKLNKEIDKKTENDLHTTWNIMITKVDQVLKELLSKNLTNKTDPQIDKQIELIELKYNELKQMPTNNDTFNSFAKDLDEMICKEDIKIGRMILNKTVFFLFNKTTWINKSPSIQEFLLIIDDFYISQRGIEREILK